MSEKKYFEYLKSISKKAILYRKYLVYKKINRFAKGPILDVGCGVGLYMSTRDDIFGTDINNYCVDHCINQYGPDRVKKMEYNKIPFFNLTFNTIILDNVIEHISDPLPLITEIKKVLSNNGLIIILVPGKKGYKKDNDHKIFYDFQSLKRLSEISKTRIIKQKSIPFWGLSNLISSFCYMVVLEKND